MEELREKEIGKAVRPWGIAAGIVGTAVALQFAPRKHGREATAFSEASTGATPNPLQTHVVLMGREKRWIALGDLV